MNDLEFAQKFVEGDKQTRDEFLKRYTRLIYKYIYSVINSKGYNSKNDQADDIFHDLFAYLIEGECSKLKTFQARNGSTLATWIRQVTVNFTFDCLRRSNNQVSLDAENESGSSLKDILADDKVSVAELLSREEELEALGDCLDELSLDDRFLIELNINQRISLEIIKDLLRASRAAVDMRKKRIFQRLRECFGRKGFKLDL